MSNFKAGGFTLTSNQLIELGAKVRNKRKDETNEVTSAVTLDYYFSEDRIGYLKAIVIPNGIEVLGAHERDGFYRCYFLVVFFEPLTSEETIEKFKPIPFEPENIDLKRALAWFGEHGYAQQEMAERWKTFSQWSFTEHTE
ncbi:hypothetical protein A7U60_g1302 [Sanghuangporus baumii]|uniref:Uncharacterized protein n=1 Tax=Sanghuangporus baumii TaxID=108892 RepID=A0A9Q5N9E5_SANBA|nr:hypothetical protein A7U60_g1302 [Sanghuangporus baumii]